MLNDSLGNDDEPVQVQKEENTRRDDRCSENVGCEFKLIRKHIQVNILQKAPHNSTKEEQYPKQQTIQLIELSILVSNCTQEPLLMEENGGHLRKQQAHVVKETDTIRDTIGDGNDAHQVMNNHARIVSKHSSVPQKEEQVK